MARHTRTPLSANGRAGRTTVCQATYARRLRFEPLEDRRMLSIIADGFGPTFAQVSRTVATFPQETATLTVDVAGHFAVFYQPNTELGYINPETGDLLTLVQFPGTSSVTTFDATIGGSGSIDAGLTNVSQLVGVHYSNGQLIASDANTLFHQDGSPLRGLGGVAGTWTYDSALANIRSSTGSYSWSQGNMMRAGSTFRHPNNVVARNTSGSIFYAANTTFYNNSTGEEFYPASVALRSTAGVYTYETGTQLDNSNVISYPSGATMVDASHNVFNADGSPATIPFSQHDTFTNSEVTTSASMVDSLTTIAVKQTVSGSTAAYVTRIHLVRPGGDYNSDGTVDAGDYVTWRKNNGTNNALANDGGLGTPIGQVHFDLWRVNFGAVTTTGAGAGVGLAIADATSPETTHSVLSIGQMDPELEVAVAPELSVAGRRVELDQWGTVLDQSEPDLQLLAVAADWQPRASTTNDLAPISATDSASQTSDPTPDTIDDAFALLATDL